MDPWVWAVLLLFVGMGLVVLDIFVPSGGIFAFLAVCAIIGAIWLGFSQGSAVGVAVLAGAVFGTLIVVILGLKYWPATSLGKRMLLQVPSSEEVLPENSPRRALEGLVGRVGRAKSKMLPSGIISVDGATLDAISEGLPIEEGNRVVVQGLADEPPGPSEKDILAQPVDWDNTDLRPPPQA